MSDPRGNPSRWVALALSVLFAVGAVCAALLGEGAHVTGVLAGMFVITFNAAFGRQGTLAQIGVALARRPRRSGPNGGQP